MSNAAEAVVVIGYARSASRHDRLICMSRMNFRNRNSLNKIHLFVQPEHNSLQEAIERMKTMLQKSTIRALRRALVGFGNPVKSRPPTGLSDGESYDSLQLEHFRSIILVKRQEALEEIRFLKELMRSSQSESGRIGSTTSPSVSDSTDMLLGEETALLLHRQSKFLVHLDKALKRIEAGTFGRCLECGALIDMGRLEAVPHTQHCMRCKTSHRRLRKST